MPKVDVSVGIELEPTTRMRQVSTMFDAPVEKKASRSWSGDVPIEERDWQIGLVVGPSGAGKSTIAHQLFGEEFRASWDAPSVVDSFDKGLSVQQISEALGAVGFNTIPAWCRPYGTLSNGEKFRCDLARTLVTPEPLVWVDEFTSVVDRQVAKIGSHALARFVRSKPGRQFVAVGCHYDVIDWLQPDWILEPADMTFAWRSVQPRPRIDAVIRRASRSIWPRFAPYHYMTANLHPGVRCFTVDVDDRPVAFAAMLPMPVSSGKYAGTAIMRVSRIVVLPDWQGCGIVFRLVETLGAAYGALGKRFRCYPGHPALINAHKRKLHLWRQMKEAGVVEGTSKRSGTSTTGAMGDRPCAVFEWIGPNMDPKVAERLLALG